MCLIIYVLTQLVFSIVQGSRGNVFPSGSSFISVSKCGKFVDKSLMIKEVMKTNTILVTAPRGFGKTTNLDMLRTFLSIPVDENGSNVNPKETEAYSVFTNLKIHKEEKFFNRHFGAHPVLYLDLKCRIPVTNVTKANQMLKRKIHESFKRHEYLVNSAQLEEEHKKSCRSWICHKTYPTLSEYEVHTGLRELAKYLCLHFNSSVFFMVDDYDSMIENSMFTAPERELVNIVELLVGKLSPLLKSNDHVGRAVVTGVSYLEAVGLFDFNFLEPFRFLEDHPLVDFYGFTESEVKSLLVKLKRGATSEVNDWYGGYHPKKGKEISCPLSILKFLNSSGEAKTHWIVNNTVPLLDNAIKVPQIREALLKMAKNESAPVSFIENVWVNDVLVLRNLVHHHSDVSKNLYLSFLFERGFLTFTKENSSCMDFPNKEIKEVFRNKLGIC